jgi:uncharacterized protein
MTHDPSSAARLSGLDLARYLAFAGMLLVNFKLAMQSSGGPDWLVGLFHVLEGKASATFVVLAGVSFTLATRAKPADQLIRWTVCRAAFLLVVGLLNLMIFPADIIHYYAVYFLLALPWLRVSTITLLIVIVVLSGMSLLALLWFDYGRGWDWAALQYVDVWTWQGFFRHLVFNGFHPLLPWLVLFLYGLLLARLPLMQQRIQCLLIFAGLCLLLVGSGLSAVFADTAWSSLTGTGPIPPGPVYVLMAIGSASCVIGACLWGCARWPNGGWTGLLPAGRMTLTLYLGHILIGMGILEALDMLHGGHDLIFTLGCAVAFLLFGTCFAWLWQKRFKYGPLEMLMRKLTAIA